MPDNSVDSCVTDPPYGLFFMNKAWDADVPPVEIWQQVYRVLKPGAYLLAFFGSRTYHRGAYRIEQAGFEIRDQLMWLYGSGMPKHKHALKPGHEPIVMARKPMQGSTADNQALWGTGGLNIDACRIPDPDGKPKGKIRRSTESKSIFFIQHKPAEWAPDQAGRWPANVLHDESDEVTGAFAEFSKKSGKHNVSRFFYSAKATRQDRGENNTWPTVKPTALMQYLCRLVTPAGGTVLDPFMGSGSTGKAAILEGFSFVGIDRDPEAFAIAKTRVVMPGDS